MTLPFVFQLNKHCTAPPGAIIHALRLVPSGTYKVQEMLQQGGWGCAQGGFTGTFTPMWLMVARKPLQ